MQNHSLPAVVVLKPQFNSHMDRETNLVISFKNSQQFGLGLPKKPEAPTWADKTL